MQLPHVISAKDFTRPQLDALFARAKQVKEYLSQNYRWTEKGHIARPLPPKLAGRTMVSFFDQPSTRTSITFETAMEHLGGRVRSYRNVSRESSLAKDEPFEDTFEMISGVSGISIIVLRHPEIDAAKRAASVSSVPIINAGDGTEHPTQALVDLFTIQEALGSVDGKLITLVGDMRARTAKSLLYALNSYGAAIGLFYPTYLPPGEEIKEWLTVNRCNFWDWREEYLSTTLSYATKASDILYVLRPQTENWNKNTEDPEKRALEIAMYLKEYYSLCTVDNRILTHMPKNSIVLHPRPRGPELPTEVDSDPRVLHAVQGRNGGPVRIALLEMMHSGEWQKLSNK